MNGNSEPYAEHRLFVEALVAYSDACTIPSLTPTCPYYRMELGYPTCGNECVSVLQANGVGGRTIGDVKIGGLVLTGRTLPVHAAGPADSYDAMRAFIEQRSAEISAQSTGTLLLRLGSTFNRAPSGSPDGAVMLAHELWAELERRGVPVEEVVRSAIIPQVATQIVMLSTMPLLRESGMWDELVSDDELNRIDERAAEWAGVLQHCYDQFGLELDDVDHVSDWIDTERTSRNLEDVFRLHDAYSSPLEDPQPALEPIDIAKRIRDVRVIYAMSTRFMNRVIQWLNRLLADDFDAVIDWAAPPPAVFSALPPTVRSSETGQWIWDRFTKTSIDSWATSSLLREWAGNDEGILDHRVWLERTCDSEVVAEMALARLTQKATRVTTAPKLSAESFVSAALRHLTDGRPEDAAEIFQGLVDLHPTDGDALNNLGFCLMQIDPERALTVLQRSSLFPMSQHAVNAANRVLALLLVGRESDALGLARDSVRGEMGDQDGQCWTWKIEWVDDRHTISLLPSTPGHYLNSLTEYLEARFA